MSEITSTEFILEDPDEVLRTAINLDMFDTLNFQSFLYCALCEGYAKPSLLLRAAQIYVDRIANRGADLVLCLRVYEAYLDLLKEYLDVPDLRKGILWADNMKLVIKKVSTGALRPKRTHNKRKKSMKKKIKALRSAIEEKQIRDAEENSPDLGLDDLY